MNIQSRKQALINRGFSFLNEQELELAAQALVIEARSPKHGDALQPFDGYREYLGTGLQANADPSAPLKEFYEKIIDHQTGKWCWNSYVGFDGDPTVEYSQQVIKERLNSIFKDGIVDLSQLHKSQAYTAIENGFAPAMKIDGSDRNLSDKYHDVVSAFAEKLDASLGKAA